MSQSGDLETVERRASPFGSLKRKRNTLEAASGHSPPITTSKAAKLTNGDLLSPNGHRQNSTATNGIQHSSPVADEVQPSENGDLLRGVGSASSLGSAASSIFSQSSRGVSYNRKSSLANGLTPDTHHTDSPTPKTNSPNYTKMISDMAAPNGVASAPHAPASATPPEPIEQRQLRPQMFPPPGKVKGYRAVWDPELDGKLSKEERKRATMRRREFGTEVRCYFHNLLSLRNMIHIT